MATKLGMLTLDLVARIGQFVEPMKTAERQTKISAGSMQREFEEADKGISMSAKNIGLSLAGVALCPFSNKRRGIAVRDVWRKVGISLCEWLSWSFVTARNVHTASRVKSPDWLRLGALFCEHCKSAVWNSEQAG